MEASLRKVVIEVIARLAGLNASFSYFCIIQSCKNSSVLIRKELFMSVVIE